MSNIRQDIIDNIRNNGDRLITGDLLQSVLLEMFDRDVFLSEDAYTNLVQRGEIDPDKIYHTYEE